MTHKSELGIWIYMHIFVDVRKRAYLSFAHYINIHRLKINNADTFFLISPCLPIIQVTSQLSTSSSNSHPNSDRWDFPRHRLKFFNILGQGAFGQVWRCEAIDIDGRLSISYISFAPIFFIRSRARFGLTVCRIGWAKNSSNPPSHPFGTRLIKNLYSLFYSHFFLLFGWVGYRKLAGKDNWGNIK